MGSRRCTKKWVQAETVGIKQSVSNLIAQFGKNSVVFVFSETKSFYAVSLSTCIKSLILIDQKCHRKTKISTCFYDVELSDWKFHYIHKTKWHDQIHARVLSATENLRVKPDSQKQFDKTNWYNVSRQ